MSGVRNTFWASVRRWCGGCSRPRKYGLSGCIPAITSSVEVSLGGGISGNDGSRRWSRCSKKERNCSRISSVLIAMAPCSLARLRAPPGDRPPADDHVAVQQARGLPRRRAVDGLAELELGPAAAVLGRHAAGHGRRAIAQLDRVDLTGGAVQPDAAQGDRAC